MLTVVVVVFVLLALSLRVLASSKTSCNEGYYGDRGMGSVWLGNGGGMFVCGGSGGLQKHHLHFGVDCFGGNLISENFSQNQMKGAQPTYPTIKENVQIKFALKQI